MLYGPPAVGKLTVARELERLTGFLLVHNHLLYDVSWKLFERGTPSSTNLSRRIRAAILEEAFAAEVRGVILTFVYAKDRTAYWSELQNFVEERGSQACFVRLTCDPKTLEQRAVSEARTAMNKLDTPEGIREKLALLKDPFGHVEGAEGFSLSTDKHTATESARLIAGHFGLDFSL